VINQLSVELHSRHGIDRARFEPRRWRSELGAPVIFLLASSCTVVELPATLSQAGENSRFLTLTPSRLPACGSAGTLLPDRKISRILAPRQEDQLLLEIPLDSFIGQFDDANDIDVVRVNFDTTYSGRKLVPMPPAIRAWTLGADRSVTDVDPETSYELTSGLHLAFDDSCMSNILGVCKGELIDDQCVQFRTTDYHIPESTALGLNFVIPISPLLAYAGYQTTIYSVQRDRGVQRMDDVLPDGVAPCGAFALGQAMWLFTTAGALLHGSFEEGFTQTATSAVGRCESRSVIAGNEHELFILSDSTQLERYDILNGDWKTFAGERIRLYPRGELGIAHVSPGEVFASGPDVLHVAGGRVSADNPPGIETPEVNASSLAYVPNFGVVVATNFGSISAKRGGAWYYLGGPEDGSIIYGIAPFRDGFVFGQSQLSNMAGFIQQVIPGEPRPIFCPVQPIAPREIDRIFNVGDGLIISSAGSGGASVSFVEPIRLCD
jgi:hypothetical protein